MPRIKVHLDTDLGGDIDDICALAFLLRSPNVDITGITVVGDTSGIRTGYTRYALKLENRNDIPVAAGADTALGYYRYDLLVPPEDKYWPEPISPSPNPPEEAIELLKNSIKNGAIIIAIGPLTNLYLLERKYPGILKKAKLFLMGGYIFPVRPGFPQWKNEYDFNIQIDVKSSIHVLKNSSPTFVPLSITAETFLKRSYIGKLKTAGSLGHLLAYQAEAFAVDEKKEEKYGKTCEGLPSDIINFQHDPLTCAIAIGWREGIEIKDIPLIIEEKEGWVYEHLDQSGRKFQVVTKVDGARFSEFWINRITYKE
jgi:purine nucleosidase